MSMGMVPLFPILNARSRGSLCLPIWGWLVATLARSIVFDPHWRMRCPTAVTVMHGIGQDNARQEARRPWLPAYSCPLLPCTIAAVHQHLPEVITLTAHPATGYCFFSQLGLAKAATWGETSVRRSQPPKNSDSSPASACQLGKVPRMTETALQ